MLSCPAKSWGLGEVESYDLPGKPKAVPYKIRAAKEAKDTNETKEAKDAKEEEAARRDGGMVG